jgi:hypothetical protein
MEKIRYKITGTRPLIICNSRLANPLDPVVREIKKITDKKKKTDEDLTEKLRMQWKGALYLNEKGQVVIPSDNVWKAMLEGARKSKSGKQVESGVMADALDYVLDYQGPKDVNKLIETEAFDIRMCGLRGSRIPVARPFFRTWSLAVGFHYEPSVINSETIDEAMMAAGELVGLGTYRSKYGRFEVERL